MLLLAPELFLKSLEIGLRAGHLFVVGRFPYRTAQARDIKFSCSLPEMHFLNDYFPPKWRDNHIVVVIGSTKPIKNLGVNLAYLSISDGKVMVGTGIEIASW